MSLHHMLRAAAGNSAGPSDPNFKNVSLLLTGDGTNGAQNNTFLDSSTNNFTITRNGNTTQGTFSPYGSLWSNYFDGSGDYLSAPSNAAFSFGTGAYTVEAWVYMNAYASSNSVVIDCGNASGSFGFFITGTVSGGTNGIPSINKYGTGPVLTAASAISLNSWSHVAIVREGTGVNQTKIYINGVLSATGTDANNWTVTNTPSIGQLTADATYSVNGYISNLRVIKGTALYTSNFTPSTTPLTAVSGTSLLTCQSNRFVDNSSNNFTLTVNGNTSVQRFSPFNPTASYSASTIGGSGYFDGTDDYLSAATSTAFSFGTGDFTVEAWVYKTTNPGYEVSIFDARAGFTATPWVFYIDVNNYPFFLGTSVYTSSIAITLNTWNHVAVSRSSGTLKIFVNGVEGYSATVTTNLDRSAGVLIGTGVSGSFDFGGYISNARIVKGTAVYTSNFTPSTTPLTAISGTSLLCNFTNAGIPDAAMMNDLETVGNAQVSTSVKKYGTGSLAFDGTGDYLMSPANGSFGLTGDFTIECWYYLNVVNSFNMILGSVGSSPSDYLAIRASVIEMAINSTNFPSWSAASTTNTWYHLAIVRQNGVIKAYRNGSALTLTNGTSTDSTVFLPINQGIYVGRFGYTADWFLNGYIDDLRITKGIARYTSNFTPPTAALPTY